MLSEANMPTWKELGCLVWFGLVWVFFPLICPGNNKNNNIKNEKNLSKDHMISSHEWTKNWIQESYAITRVTFV